MITNCPHCGRGVANTEAVSRVNGVWYPTACLNGDTSLCLHGPIVTNHLWFYCSVIDPETRRKALVVGPYDHYDKAEAELRHVTRLVNEVDYRGPWYGYGIASSNTKHQTRFGTLAPVAVPVGLPEQSNGMSHDENLDYLEGV